MKTSACRLILLGSLVSLFSLDFVVAKASDRVFDIDAHRDDLERFVGEINSAQKFWKAKNNDVVKNYLSTTPSNSTRALTPTQIAKSSLVGPFGLALKNVHPSSDSSLYREFEHTRNLPRSWDLRATSQGDFMTDVRNQGRCGSCIAFSALGLFEGQLNVTSSAPTLDRNLSEQDLFARIGNCKDGASVVRALDEVVRRGVPDESCMLYESGREGVDISFSKTCSSRDRRAFKAKSHRRIATQNLKQALLTGPVLSTMTVYEDFLFYKEGVYRYTFGKPVGGHGVVIVGYNDDLGAWIVKNSWGSGWGDQGYFMVQYGDPSGVGVSNWQLQVPEHKVLAKVKQDHPVQVFESQKVHVATEQVRSDISQVQWKIRNASGQELSSGLLSSNSGLIDLSGQGLPVGMYEISLIPLRTDDSPVNNSSDWIDSFVVFDKATVFGASLQPMFDPALPQSGSMMFQLSGTPSLGGVPTQSATLGSFVIGTKDTDGQEQIVRVIEMPWPGERANFGVRSTTLPDGHYWSKGTLGYGTALQEISPAVEFEVKTQAD